MNQKTVRERADAIEKLQDSFSTETARRSNTTLPSYSRSTVSSFKRSSLSGSTDTNYRLNKLRRLDSPNREFSPTPSDISVSSSKEDNNIDSIVLYAKILQYQHSIYEIEQEYEKSEQIAKSELESLKKELNELQVKEINQQKEQESQNKLDELCKQTTSCLNQIDIITKQGSGDLDKEKQILTSILDQLNETNVPTLNIYNDQTLLIECKNLIKSIIEV